MNAGDRRQESEVLSCGVAARGFLFLDSRLRGNDKSLLVVCVKCVSVEVLK